MWFLEEPHSQEGERGPDPCLVLHGEAFSDAPHGVNSFPYSPHTTPPAAIRAHLKSVVPFSLCVFEP